MRVILPYLPPIKGDVLWALRATHWELSARVVGSSERDYFDLLADAWATGETFCVVEHDIVVNPDSLDELYGCPHDWCAFPYRYGTCERYYGLGCVKFSADLIARCPDAMTRVGVMSDPTHEKRHWCRLDSWLQYVILPNFGEQMHRHDTPVGHLGGRVAAHGCTEYM